MSSGWHNEFVVTHQDDIPTPAKSSGSHNALAISHPGEIRSGANSPGWLTISPYLMRMTKLHVNPKPSGGLNWRWYLIRMTYGQCHPDDIRSHPQLSHPDYIPFHLMSPGWLNWGWHRIRMIYGQCIMSSGWQTPPILSHPDNTPFHLMSSGWLNWGWYLFRMSYGEFIIIINVIRISQHEVVLQLQLVLPYYVAQLLCDVAM